MKIKSSNIKWFIIFIASILANFHVTYLIIKAYDSSKLKEPAQSKYQLIKNSETHLERIQSEDHANMSFPVSSHVVHHNHISKLPAFAHDESEFILSSIIERSFKSTIILHLNTFFLNHYMLDPSNEPFGAPRKVHPSTKVKWKKLAYKYSSQKLRYDSIGRRADGYKYVCRIQNQFDDEFYDVIGHFMPNRLTQDPNSNRQLDVLRCPLNIAEFSLLNLSSSNKELQIEILRNDVSLINFAVPWNSRRSGYLMSSIEGASHLHSWMGIENVTTNPLKEQSKLPVVHLCVPGTRLIATKKYLPMLLEFVSHHQLIGFDHIYLPVSLGWKSQSMKNMLSIFKSYIDEGKLTILSQAGDQLDMTMSVFGLNWHRYTIKSFQSNMMLYYTKGMADYLAVFDIDEFFIPRPKYRSIQDLIMANDRLHLHQLSALQKMSSTVASWKGGPGWADKSPHPFCFLGLSSAYVGLKRKFGHESSFEFLGKAFSHAAEPDHQHSNSKVLIPTRRIFQAGLGGSIGACRLENEWTPCKNSNASAEPEFCYSDDPSRVLMPEFRFDHSFDDIVTSADSKFLDFETEAFLLHFLAFKDVYASPAALSKPGEYSTRFFDNVLNDIKSRQVNLDSLVAAMTSPSELEPADIGWGKLFEANEKNAALIQSNSITTTYDSGPFPPLPNNFSMRSQQAEVQLPNFDVNFTDYVLGAMVERESDSFNLYLTTFFMCHWLLEPKEGASAEGAVKMSPEVVDVWKKAMTNFEQTYYTAAGQRIQQPQLYCRIKNSELSESYTVPGMFVPNQLTPDTNSNRRLDVFRCEMKDTKNAYMKFARALNESVIVEILRGDEPIIAFRVPWFTRTTGYMLSGPGSIASVWDPWHGFDPQTPGKWSHDDVYLCVPGLESPISKSSLPLYLEFVQHHLLIGVDHVFVTALFGWDSPNMKLLLRVFEQYIQEGKVSISSHSGDGYDHVYSTGGLAWGRDNIKTFQVNMCTYYSKGSARYVGVWDYDEHFYPLNNFTSIQEVIYDIDTVSPIPYFHAEDTLPSDIVYKWTGGKGLADGDGHPLCYMVLNSAVTLNDVSAGAHSNTDLPWIGQKFDHGWEPLGHGLGFQKSIRPTARIFSGGLHLGGTCRLPREWNGGCKDSDFCASQQPDIHRLSRFSNGTVFNFHLDHRFDEVVYDEDAKLISPHTHALINHIQFHRNWFGASKLALERPSTYTTQFFPRVLKELQRRGLELPMSLPEIASKPFPDPDYSWVDFNEVYSIANQKFLNNSISSLRNRQDRNTSTTLARVLLSNDESPQQSSTPTTDFIHTFPSFSFDKSELILGSIIERVSESWTLYLTTFMVSHQLLVPNPVGTSVLKIKNSEVVQYEEFLKKSSKHSYYFDGRRNPKTKYYCLIRNSNAIDDVAYKAEGAFLPNKLTPDSNANRRFDVFRCKMQNTVDAYKTLANSDFKLSVEILRDESVIAKFVVPWKTRVQSEMLSSPVSSKATTFDAWKGGFSEKNSWSEDEIYMCVPGLDSPPSKKNVAIYLEFVQHHLNMGASHIFLASPFTWDSIHMNRLLQIFKSYIDEGTVSFSTHATDGYDYLYSTANLSWHRDNIKIFQVNMCTYLAKGMAKYVAVWDVDEFFIPKGKNKNFGDVLSGFEGTSQTSQSVTVLPADEPPLNWADKYQHPFCYLIMNSEVVASPNALGLTDMNNLWLGTSFSHDVEDEHSYVGKKFGFKKQIIPTRTIFQVGLHVSGACHLPSPWNGCQNTSLDEFCYSNKGLVFLENLIPPHSTHSFNQPVTDGSAKRVSSSSAVLYHFMIYRYYHSIQNITVKSRKNDYSSKFFENTLTELRKRNLDLILAIPNVVLRGQTADSTWIKYEEVYSQRNAQSLFPDLE